MGGSAAQDGAGGVVISGLSKACLRARAWCDVAPANTVCCLASEGEQDEQDEEGLGRAGGVVALDDNDGDDEEGEEAPTHTFDDDSEDDTAHDQQVLCQFLAPGMVL